METLFLRVLAVSAAVSLLLLPLLLGRRRLEARYAAQTRWMLWLSVAAVLLIAPLLPRTMAPVQVEVPARAVVFVRAQPVAGAAETAQIVVPAAPVQQAGVTQSIPAVTAPAPAVYEPVDWTEGAAWLWLAVAALLLAVQAVRYLLTRRRLLRASRPLERRERAEVRVLPGLESPVTVGFLRPVVFLPSAQTDPMALGHELTHIKRRDIWGKGLLFLACALYWFHPLVWLMARQADRDMEAACDGQLAKALAPEERKAYGALLLSAAEDGGRVPFSTRFGGSKEQMKARLTQLFRPGKTSRALVCAVLALAVILGSLVACRGEEPEEPEEEPLADGVYCAALSEISYPVGEDDGSIRLSLLAYDEANGPRGEVLGEYTLPLSAELTLRRSEGEEEKAAGEKGTEEWERTVVNFTMWPLLQSMYIPDMDDYLTVEIQGGEVVRMAWVMVSDSTCYVNAERGFTLVLPDSWAGQYRVESGGMVMDFYQTQGEEGTERLLMDLVITPRETFQEVYGDKDLEGMYNSGGPWLKILYEGDNVIYAHIDPVVLSEAPKDEGEEQYLTMVRDAIAELGPEDFALYRGAALVEDVGQALRQVLAGERSFTDRETGETRYVNALGESDGVPVTVCRYTFLDMDGDGTEELVLWLKRGEEEYQLGSLVLRWQEGQAYGWRQGFRAMNLLTLKADGTYTVSYGGDNWGYGTMDFTGETESGTREYTYCRGSGNGVDYFVQGAPADREAFYAALDEEDAKSEPVWYDAATGEALRRTEDQTYVSVYDERIKCMTIEGFALGTPFEDLPQSFRDTLTKEGAEDLTGEGAGLWTTYTAPGIEVVTTQINPDWEALSESEREEHKGKEFLATVRVTDSAYATQAGLKVGDSVERCGELGYDELLMSSDYCYRMGLQWLNLTVEDGVITGMESFDGARYVGSIFY